MRVTIFLVSFIAAIPFAASAPQGSPSPALGSPRISVDIESWLDKGKNSNIFVGIHPQIGGVRRTCEFEDGVPKGQRLKKGLVNTPCECVCFASMFTHAHIRKSAAEDLIAPNSPSIQIFGISQSPSLRQLEGIQTPKPAALRTANANLLSSGMRFSHLSQLCSAISRPETQRERSFVIIF